MTPRCPKNFSLMNTPGSLDSLVVKTMENLGSHVVNTWEDLSPCDEYTKDSRLPGLFATRIRTGLPKKLLVPTAGSHNSTVYSLQRSLCSL
jgi:hypothetical protein